MTVSFPAGQSTTSSVDAGVASTALPASNGTDDCLGAYDSGAGRFPGTVSASDVAFVSMRDPQTATGIITDPAMMAAFVGPGTVSFSWTSASNADINQPSEWDIFFIAEGELSVSVTYTYTPTLATTTTSTGGGGTTTTAPPNPTTTIGGPGGTTTTAPDLPTTTAPGGQLPRTGGSSNQTLVLAALTLALGGAMVLAGRMRLSRNR